MKTPLFPLIALAVVAVACRRADPVDAQQRGGSAAQSSSAAPAKVVDAAVAPWRRELLRLAFDAASKFPSTPHHKNRGRAQDLVVAEAFALDLPQLALSFAPRVEGWRRGAAYADYAWASAKAGAVADAQRFVELAQGVLREQSRDPNGQEWRGDHVRLKLARALHALGDEGAAGELTAGIDATTSGAVDEAWTSTIASRVDRLTPTEARRELLRIDDTWTAQTLGDQYTSLVLIGLIHRRCFDDVELRAACENRLFDHYDKLPLGLRTEAMRPLVDGYLEHGDRSAARDVVNRIAGLVDGFRWRAEDLVPQLAAIAGLRAKIGEADRARQELEAARTRYLERREQIVDIFRCETLRAVAMAYADLGDHDTALEVVTLAVEEGMENPNSRPRCDDLVETCVAMVKHDLEPSAELLVRLQEIRDGLGDPW